MSDLQEPTPNISSLSVLYPEGNFPSHIDIFGKGGFIALNDAIGGSGYNEFINERVTLERRKPGMLVYINSDNTYHKCATAGSSESTGEWDRQYFSGRYFYGASAPTASDVVIGEKWFNTDVGSEFTYLPIDENQNTFFWVDIDHLGQGESGDIGIDLLVNGVSFATDSPTLNITGSSPINVASEGGNGYRISLTDNFVNTSGDTMNGTLTGTDASFDSITASDGFIGTLTGEKASFRNTQDGRASLEVAIGSTGYTDNFWDFVAGTIVNEEGLTSNVFGVSTTSHSQTPSAGVFNGNLRVGQSDYNEKALLEVLGSAVVSNSLSYENQPTVKIQKNDGTTEENSGRFPGTTGFMDLPRLVLEHKPSNSWGWPGAIDFMTKPVLGSQITSIGYRIGTLFANSGESNLYFWGSPARNTTYGAGATGISAGLSGDGLTALGYFQYAVGAADSGFHIMKGFRTSNDEEFQDNEFITKRVSIMKPLADLNENGGTVSEDIKYNQIWDSNLDADNFTFASLTEEKMGFSFPVNITIRIAGGAGPGGNYSTRWFVKDLIGVSPTNGATAITITADRDRVIPWESGDADCAVYDTNTNTITLGGSIKDNPNQKVWAFLDVSPTPLT